MENKVFIIKTFQNNEVPAAFSDVKIYVEGQDIVIRTQEGETYEYPFAAQFLAMSKDAFNLSFTDGKVISSTELLNYIDKNNFDIDGSLNHHKSDTPETTAQQDTQAKDTKEAQSQDEQENESGGEGDGESIAEVQVVEVVKVEEVVVEKVSATQQGETSNNKLNPVSSEFINVAEFEVNGAPERPQVIPSSSASPKDTHEVVYVVDRYLTTDKFNMGTYQKGMDINVVEQLIRIGGSRTDASYSSQYGRITYDGRESKNDWHVDTQLNGWNYQDGKIMRVVSVDNVDSLSSVKFRSAMSSDYQLILAGTPEGDKLGLKANEFVVIYPSKDNTFSVEIEFKQDSGELDDSNKGILDFVVSPSPDAITNQNGSINLGYTPNDITVKLGSGDDTVTAGKGEDVYDGGEGRNTLDYSGSTGAITFDQSVDISEKLAQFGVQSGDAGQVSISGGKSQYVNRFETIVGSDHGDTFILNAKGHTIKGGKGDDTFSLQGGSNVLQGGEGHNTLDYSRAGGEQNYNTISVLGRDTDLGVNGITVDFTQNTTTNNGWNDGGQDTFSDIQEIIGSSQNDHIILGDRDVNIVETVGDNYIEAGNGSYIIDGGKENTVLDYTRVTDAIRVDLNRGQVSKGHNTDVLSNIHHVIGSQGGTDFIGKTAGANTLVGVDGQNTFTVLNGNNTLYGGLGTNQYTLDSGLSTIWARGTENVATVENSLLTYHGASGETGQDSDYINRLTYDGGSVTYTAGDGHSTNEITSLNGGIITLHAKGSSSFTAKNGGTNIVFLDEGSLVYGAENGGENTITAATNTQLTVLGGKASHTVTLAETSHVALNYADYSKGTSGHTLTIDLADKRTVSVDNDRYIDLLNGDGLVNQIQGLDEGNTNIKLSQTRQEDMTIDLFGQNNSVLVGKGFVDIAVNNANETNKIDYSQLSERLSFDLSSDKGNLYRYDNQGQPLRDEGESLTNVNYIIGNNANGNVYKATDKFGVTFETGQGEGNTIIETEGDHTYKLQGKKITYDASELDHGITFEYQNIASGVVTKNTSESTLIGTSTEGTSPYINKIIGTSQDDTFIFNVDQRNGTANDVISLITGGGNNDITVKNYGILDINNTDTSKPDGEKNTLTLAYGDNGTSSVDIINFDGSSGQKGTVKIGTVSDILDTAVSGYLTKSVIDFNFIDKINYTGNNDFRANWGTAQSVHLTVDNGDKNVSLFVNGGNNVIDLGYTGGLNETAFASYVNTKNAGIIYDATKADNIVSFTDGRGHDKLTNFNVIQGTNGNDTLTLKSGLKLISSSGNDTLTGNGAVYQLNKTHTQVNADFAKGTIAKYQGTSSYGIDTLSGTGFSKFINSTASTKATIYSSLDNDMAFELKQGNVDFYSNVKTSNTIQTDNAALTLHYEKFTDSITLDNNTVTKTDGKTDTFTTAAVINGTDYGDSYNIIDVNTTEGLGLNYNQSLTINAGKGSDSFRFTHIHNEITINAVKNDNDNSDSYYIDGDTVGNIIINSKNANNYFSLDWLFFKGSINVDSEGGNDFLLREVNFNNNRAYALNINLISSDYLNENNFKISDKVYRTNITLQGGKNIFNVEDATTYLLNVTADEKSHNVFNAKDSMVNINFTSKYGSDEFILDNINNDKNNRSVFNVNDGNNNLQGEGNYFTIINKSHQLTINAGVRDDHYNFKNVNASNLIINDKGGNNFFDLSGKFTSSTITTGGGNDTFFFNAIQLGSSSGLNINAGEGNNTFKFEGNNSTSNLVISSGSGNDTFNFNAGSMNQLKNSDGSIQGVKVTVSGGNNVYNFADEKSLPAQIDGGKGIDRLTFKGEELSNFDVFTYTLNQTKNIEQMDFTALLSGKGNIILDFYAFKSLYENSHSDDHLDIYLGSKDTVSVIDGSEIGWTQTDNTDGSVTYSNTALGIGYVTVHYGEQPPTLA
ncbi:beta strand repeat-containing protein [Providencia rettgeri]